MKSPTASPLTSEIDDATIDGAADGISPGHGLLASMMSWLRKTITRGPRPGVLLEGALTPDLDQVDPKIRPEGPFDPAVLMDALLRYSQRYSRELSKRGLVLCIGQTLPPAAFPAFEGAGAFGHPTATAALLLREHTALEGAHGDDARGQPVALASPDQVAWLANAILVRAATRMAPMVSATPHLKFVDGHLPPTLEFVHKDATFRVGINPESSPVSLHRSARESIQGRWHSFLVKETVDVVHEFMAAIRDAGMSELDAMAFKVNLSTALAEYAPLRKMRKSSAAFIDISAIAKTCREFVEKTDRTAMRNALRHASLALTWASYLTHAKARFQTEIAQHEPAGALAYANYGPELLTELCRCSGGAKEDLSVSLAFGAGLQASGGGANTIWSQGTADEGYTGTLTHAFLAALQKNASSTTRDALAALSPRYLGIVAIGHASSGSFEHRLRARAGPADDDAALIPLAVCAGTRLANVLNHIAANAVPGRAWLPWARVLSSDTSYELLLSRDAGRAETGLQNLFVYANGMRSKGQRALDHVFNLPGAEACMDAPATNAVDALVGRYAAAAPSKWGRMDRAAHGLLQEFLCSAGLVTTRVPSADDRARRILQWQPKLARFTLDEAVCVALCNPGTRRGGTWSLMTISARSGAKHEDLPHPAVDQDHYVFFIRGSGTPIAAPTLQIEITIPEHTWFRALSDRSTKGSGWSPLTMKSISGPGIEHPHLATRVADADRSTIPSMQEHANAAMASWGDQVQALLAQSPYRAAALFPAVAKFLWAGGLLADDQALRPIATASAFKLARACLGNGNPYGLGLLCRYVTRPGHRAGNGVSILDMALEAQSMSMAQGAMEGLRKNSRLADAGALAAVVQASMGKLVERHPELIPLAMTLGAKADDTVMNAWNGLHPQRRTEQIQAAINHSLMSMAIDRAASSASAGSAVPRPRRRAGAI